MSSILYFHQMKITLMTGYKNYRKENLIMNKNKILSFVGMLVPVAIAAISTWSEQVESKRQEEELDDMKQRIEKLESETK